MDSEDQRILSLLQTEFPVAARPFDVLAERLGMEPEDFLARIRRLAEAGVIRRVGPVFDSRRLGYTSTLAASRVPAERLAEVAERVSRLPGVTHNYERRGDYNLWFTLTAQSEREIAETLDALRRETGIVFYSLPALAAYKIRAVFGADEATSGVLPRKESPSPELDDKQRQLVRTLGDGIAIEAEPFASVAKRVGRTVEEVLSQIRAWMEEGVIRRFGAVVAHRRVGYRANGMAVFNLPADRVDEAGRALAERPEITHCYRRPPIPDFPYTLYAMIHGQSEEAVRALADRLAQEIGAANHALLFSTTEFKKSPMRYFEPEDRP
ncbi:MAG: AsnC family transcriptional regulator [Planctomycetota bacterium]|nr:AsnC family transcriptional regulator [Planctomycetota bacterium]